jgi:hypothetical protein
MTGDQIVVVDGSDNTAGRIVYGRLSGTIEYETLVDAWKERDLPEEILPKAPTKEYALRRAFRELGAKRMLVRPLGDDVAGYALVHERASSSALSHEQDLTGSLAKGSDGELHLTLSPHDHPYAAQVRQRFAEAQDELDTRLFSHWFWKKVIDWVDAVAQRPGGGMYFVPRQRLDDWYKAIEVIKEVSDHKIFSIPAMHCNEAVEAILDAILCESEDMLSKIDSELSAYQKGEKAMGSRALKNRVSVCDAATAKLEVYEELLEMKLDSIQERVGNLQAKYSQQVFLAEAAEAAEKEERTNMKEVA